MPVIIVITILGLAITAIMANSAKRELENSRKLEIRELLVKLEPGTSSYGDFKCRVKNSGIFQRRIIFDEAILGRESIGKYPIFEEKMWITDDEISRDDGDTYILEHREQVDFLTQLVNNLEKKSDMEALAEQAVRQAAADRERERRRTEIVAPIVSHGPHEGFTIGKRIEDWDINSKFYAVMEYYEREKPEYKNYLNKKLEMFGRETVIEKEYGKLKEKGLI